MAFRKQQGPTQSLKGDTVVYYQDQHARDESPNMFQGTILKKLSSVIANSTEFKSHKNNSSDIMVSKIDQNQNKLHLQQSIENGKFGNKRMADPKEFIIQAHSSTLILDGDCSARSIDSQFFRLEDNASYHMKPKTIAEDYNEARKQFGSEIQKTKSKPLKHWNYETCMKSPQTEEKKYKQLSFKK